MFLGSRLPFRIFKLVWTFYIVLDLHGMHGKPIEHSPLLSSLQTWCDLYFNLSSMHVMVFCAYALFEKPLS